MSRNDDEVAQELATNYRPKRAKHAAVEVPPWFMILLVLLALAPTLLVVVYALLIE